MTVPNSAEEGGYLAVCPILQDCHAEGNTIAEVIEKLEYGANMLPELRKEYALPILNGLIIEQDFSGMTLPLQEIRRFSVEEYHRMGEVGILQPDERVELIDGVLKQMSPIGNQHAACVSKLMNLLLPPLQGRALVRVQNPIVLNDNTEPEPDVAIVK